MSYPIPTAPFDLTLTLNTAPSWPMALDLEPGEEYYDLEGASIWFAVKALPTDTDGNALIFASTANSKIAITDAVNREFQVDLLKADTQPSATLLAGATYYAYVKVQLASGETRVCSGMVTTVQSGIDAP